MQKELSTILAVTLVTIIITLTAIRFFAPHLLGVEVPVDLQMVQVAKEVPPFFDGVFRDADRASTEWMIPDPYIKRHKPFLANHVSSGPHDLLGFRNESVPNQADIIAIGDSQTYGANATMEQSWPFQLRESLSPDRPSVYSMAVHGWGAIEYLEIFRKAIFFSPKLIIIAFYTGNDPAETFRLAYGNEKWERYRANDNLSTADYPTASWPPPASEQEYLIFRDGSERGFTPKMRGISNLRLPAVDKAYSIMAKTAQEIGEIAGKEKVQVLFTVIPTKELVHARRAEIEGLRVSEDFAALVRAEKEQIIHFSAQLSAIQGCDYVDIVADLQELAMGGRAIYPSTSDGHPLPEGYAAIARLLAPAVRRLLLLEQGEADPEESRILKGLKPNRENGKKLLDLAQAYTAVDNLEQAIYVYERYLAVIPDDIDSWSYLSAILFQKGEPSKAFAAVEKALDINPTHEKTLFNKAIFLLNSNQKELGIAVLTEIVSRNPEAVDPNGVPLPQVIERLRQQQ